MAEVSFTLKAAKYEGYERWTATWVFVDAGGRDSFLQAPQAGIPIAQDIVFGADISASRYLEVWVWAEGATSPRKLGKYEPFEARDSHTYIVDMSTGEITAVGPPPNLGEMLTSIIGTVLVLGVSVTMVIRMAKALRPGR